MNNIPVEFIKGKGSVKENANKFREFGNRCLIVTGGSSAEKSGALKDVCDALSSQKIDFKVYNGIKPNPTISDCIKGGLEAYDFCADFVIGIGGGSPMDAAKVVALGAANPGVNSVDIYKADSLDKPLPVIEIGTTSGTGSEVTPVAVITNDQGLKKSIRGDFMYPVLSFGDPTYSYSMPAGLTASTGVDALAHCLESYFSKKSTDESAVYAVAGIKEMVAPLKKVASGLALSEEERDSLYYASISGGCAIAITGTVFPHNMGYFLTENHFIPHGFACACFLPALLRHALKADKDRTEKLCEKTGETVEELISLIKALTPDSGVKLSSKEIDALLPRWENNPSIEKTVGSVSRDDVKNILTELFGN